MDFSHVTVLCLGDLMLDRFIEGEIERISPEAPVPVIWLTQNRQMLGGVGNVANNITALGGRAILLGLAADDEAGAALHAALAANPGIQSAIVITDARPTICKSRFIAGGQQVVRTDQESRLPLQPAEQAALVAKLQAAIAQADALILSDYRKGVLSPAVIDAAMALAQARNIPVFVDPKSHDLSCFRGAACLTPNLRELALATAMPVDTEAAVIAAARHLLAQAQAGAVLATRSEKGMMLIEADGAVHSVPARARDVFDVSGAGDTVIATLALSHAAGRSLAQAMHIANAAAGVVVSKLGTATASVEEVLHELEQQHEDDTQIAGLLPLPRVEALVARWKQQGLQVGLTNGCFDILHPGHVSLLAAARRTCDRLVVALNSDASVRRLKGPQRPVNGLHQRAQVMAAIRHVDCVVAFAEDTPLELIRRLLPQVLVKGADYAVGQIAGADLVIAAGGKVVLAELVPGQSTTAMIGRINEPAPV